MKLLIAAAFLVVGASAAPPCASSAAIQQACCKVCKKGKACGDSCIARNKRCTKAPGCACDG